MGMRVVDVNAARRCRRALRGVAFVYFALLTIPVFFFGAGLAVDFVSLIGTNRKVAMATQAAALAGSHTFNEDQATISPDATGVARDTFCEAMENYGQVPVEAAGGSGTCGVSLSIDLTSTTITVTSSYRVDGLIFAQLLGAGGHSGATAVTRTANVCNPEGSHYCAAPQ